MYYIPYLRTFADYEADWSLGNVFGGSSRFTPKPISKEARIALKRKRKQVKKSRKKNR